MNIEAYLEFRNECINKTADINTTYDDKVNFVLNTAELIVRKIVIPYPNNQTTEQDFINKADSFPHNFKHFIKSCVVDIVDMAYSDIEHKKSGTKDPDAVKKYYNSIESIQELYACLFVQYFGTFEFGSNMNIANRFSLLPPIIRCKTLQHLYAMNPNNIVIIDKLGLSITKAYDTKTTAKWIMQNEEHLKSIPAASKEMIEMIPEFAEHTMYDSCVGKINPDYESIYADFETLKASYYSKGIMDGETQEILMFNDYMQFAYECLEKIPSPITKGGNPYFLLSYFDSFK